MTTPVGGHLAGLFARGAFTVTGEIVPPAGGSLVPIRAHAVALVGSVDAVNLVPSLYPLTWPQLPVVTSLGVLVAALPAVVAPKPPTEAASGRSPHQTEAASPPGRPLAVGGARR